MINLRIFNRSILAILSLIGLVFLIHGIINLLKGDNLPVDLALRYWQSKELILEHINIYKLSVHTQYPPSFYLFLIPFLHIFSYQFADLTWLFVNLFLLVSAVYILNKLAKDLPSPLKWFLPICFFCFHAIPHGLGVGQVHLMIPIGLLIYVYLSELDKKNYISQTFALFFLTVALGKLSLSIPFALLFLLENNHRKNILYAILINFILSGIILYFANSSILEYVELLLKNSNAVTSLGQIDIQRLTSFLGLPPFVSLFLGISMLLTFIFTVKTYLSTILDKLAIAALTARFFMYHAHYDNTILIFVLIALFYKSASTQTRKIDFIIISLFVVSMIIPARFLEWNAPTYGLFLIFQVLIWVSSGWVIIKNKTSLTAN